MARPFRHWVPTRDAVRLVLAPALVFIATSLDRGYQTDYWQHLARGRLIAQERALVSDDRFTFTVPGRSYYDNNWLTQLLYYGVHRAGGLEAVQFMNSAALAATLAILVALCRRASGSTAIAAGAGVVAFLGLWQTFLIRPQTFSMLLFVGLYALLEAARRRPGLLLWAPVVMALWANVHGGFAVGLALLLAWTAGAAWEHVGPRVASFLPTRRGKLCAAPDADADEPSSTAERSTTSDAPSQLFPLLACLVVSIAATLANPYGWNVYRYAGKLSAVGVARGIEEWLPPSPGSLIGAVWAASLALLCFLLIASRRRPTPREVCLLAAFALPACLSVRMTVWWFLAAIPVMARLAGGLNFAIRAAEPVRPRERRSATAATALAVIACMAVLSLPWLERYHPAMGTLRPVGRIEADLAAVADRLPAGQRRARVFTRMEWANYLAWRAADRASVFVEGRVELYPDDAWQDYLRVSAGGEGWERVLDAHAVGYLLLDRTYHAALIDRVGRSPQWTRRAHAGPAVLFERGSAASREAPAGAAAGVAGIDF